MAALLTGRGLPPLRAALLKGRQHYLCTRRFYEWRTSHRLTPVELTVLAKVLVWLPTTQTGEDSELTFFSDAERAIWRRFCSDGGACSLERCGRAWGAALGLPDVDFYLEARRRSEQAHLVVVNHALVAWLGGVGRLVAIGFTVLSVAAAMTSAAPAVFDALRVFSPISPALDAIRAVLTESSGAVTSTYVLLGWLIAGLAASAIAVVRQRTTTLTDLATLHGLAA